MSLVAGVDFGTASVRVAVVDAGRGCLGRAVAPIATHRSAADPHLATQSHADHCLALERAFGAALAAAGVRGTELSALAIDTTGSTIVPLDRRLRPLDEYMLWCDHRAWREAEEITAQAGNVGLEALHYCGGAYSPEWGYAKVLHWLRANPDRRAQLHTAAEHCDYIVAELCGIDEPAALPRSTCAMGHKWMWDAGREAQPAAAFLASVDPLLAAVPGLHAGRVGNSAMVAGTVCSAWAARLGVRTGIPVPFGALDAHWDALGAGCRPGDVVNVLGTSACIMALSDRYVPIPGVSGVVRGSIHPAHVGVEAGLAAVGSLFEAIAQRAGSDVGTLTAAVQAYRAGQSGLLRFAWDNGDRSVLADPQLTGVTLGWRLDSTAADEFHAAIEGTAFQTRIIIEQLQRYGVPCRRVIHGGGIPGNNAALNRIYASVLNVPVMVPKREVTGLGAAMFALLAAGDFRTLDEAQRALAPDYEVFEPDVESSRAYERGYAAFRKLYRELATLGELRRLRASPLTLRTEGQADLGA